ncbi:hypothetical protein ACFOLA_08315 [Salinicoccus hispanicus]|uniref:Uncharacterized protein n=1 Tax=Salinicoccus hispanicus TaxID=157225 RepID=A0A6N8U111_9STAP|nr:hypothetical protein [Salinicoccus hispanicus]MXQ51760.1 hypothetical protein [Salinicoccus hispanicus]
MRRVILILLILMQVMFFINYIINDGVIFFNIYVWALLSLISLTAGWKATNSEPNLYENSNIHLALSITLLLMSVMSLIFILLIIITRPYFL